MRAPRALAASALTLTVVVLSACTELDSPGEDADPTAAASAWEDAEVACIDGPSLVLELTDRGEPAPSSGAVESMVDSARGFAEATDDPEAQDAATSFADELEGWVDDPSAHADDLRKSADLLTRSSEMSEHCPDINEIRASQRDALEDEG